MLSLDYWSIHVGHSANWPNLDSWLTLSASISPKEAFVTRGQITLRRPQLYEKVWTSPMQKLAKAFKPQELAQDAYPLYERFRPSIPEGVKGWGAKGDLDLGLIKRLVKENG